MLGADVVVAKAQRRLQRALERLLGGLVEGQLEQPRRVGGFLNFVSLPALLAPDMPVSRGEN